MIAVQVMILAAPKVMNRGLPSVLRLDIPFLTMHGKGTFLAFGIPCGADLSAEQHDPMTEIAAFFRGQDLAQLPLHLLRLFALGQTQTTADANAMGVANHAAGLLINITQ